MHAFAGTFRSAIALELNDNERPLRTFAEPHTEPLTNVS